MSFKMPILNQDILEGIVPYFNFFNNEENEKEAVEALEKFMLSGKEPYEAVLRHFSHVYCVIIASDTIGIITKRHILRRDRDCNLYKLPYNFSFLNENLAVLEESNIKLVIEDYPSSFVGRKTLTYFVRKDLKCIAFDDGKKLRPDYYKFFQNECHFDDAHLTLCNKKPSLLDFLEFPSKHHRITTHLENFVQQLQLTNYEIFCEHSFEKSFDFASLNIPLSYKSGFPAVESLTFNQCGCDGPPDEFDLTSAQGICDFSMLIIKSFPNLKTLVVEFSVFFDEPKFHVPMFLPQFAMNLWAFINDEMSEFNPEMFKHIPLKIKGAFKFSYCKEKAILKDILKELPPTNPGIEMDEGKKRLVKKFEIHDGLSFEFVYPLGDGIDEQEL